MCYMMLLCAKSFHKLFDLLSKHLERFEVAGCFVAACQCTCHVNEIKWCVKMYFGGSVFRDPELLQGLVDLCRPATAGALTRYFQAMNWMWISLLRTADVVAPIREILGDYLNGNVHRTKRLPANRRIAEESWTPVRAHA